MFTGEFGSVYKAKLRGEVVAVKILKGKCVLANDV